MKRIEKRENPRLMIVCGATQDGSGGGAQPAFHRRSFPRGRRTEVIMGIELIGGKPESAKVAYRFSKRSRLHCNWESWFSHSLGQHRKLVVCS